MTKEDYEDQIDLYMERYTRINNKKAKDVWLTMADKAAQKLKQLQETINQK